MTPIACYSCAENEHLQSHQPETAIWLSDEWRVAHSLNSALLGWLVVMPRRHVEGVHELNDVEVAALGPLLRQVSARLVDVLGCAKTYVVMFAEQPGFTQLHFHVIPRNADLPDEFRGAKGFDFMKRPKAQWVSLEQRHELALRLRERRGQG
jgi:diadenosine tetraphosphate (Ap4A) HIT family hydrolase